MKSEPLTQRQVFSAPGLSPAPLKTESVRIPVREGLLSGQLFNASAMPSAPAILIESELAGSRDERTLYVAHRLATAGWTVLVYDHAGFGGSGGASTRMNWSRQTAHLKDVWWWLRRRVGIDGNRVGIWARGIGAWRARLLAETERDIPALVLETPVWRHRSWLTTPSTGLALLQLAGYFGDSEPDPLLNPRWTLAWLELLKAPLPRPARMPDIPVLVWHPDDDPSKAACREGMGAVPRLEWMRLMTSSPHPVALTGQTEPDPVIRETDAFFRQYV